jgi:hypothetical protein
MMKLLKANERGIADFGWLDSRHTFSFGEYYNPNRMGFRALRVINEDRIHGGSGFPTHPHRDMEIISYVMEGALEHRDTLGNATVIRPGEVQKMSAGTGIRHSEFNASTNETAHFLQIWILPDKEGHQPNYGQKSFTKDFESKNWVLVASPDGQDGSIELHQDARMYVGKFKQGETQKVELAQDRHAWIQVVKGDLKVNGTEAASSDGIAISGEKSLTIESTSNSEFILFDLA